MSSDRNDSQPCFFARLSKYFWIVYAKRPFAGAHTVVRYLGRYTHRGPIASSRLLGMEQDRVRFRWKDSRVQGQAKVMELSAEEFIRRYLQHVLPQGFVRIRGYGLYANAGRAKRLARCRALFEAQLQVSERAPVQSTEPSASDEEPVAAKAPCSACGSTCLVRQAEWHAGERPPILPEQAQGQAA
ncbi:MAG: transposase [Gemmatimonadetes bacterium]|nr:transposase [Gemmatimonadota bacterium]